MYFYKELTQYEINDIFNNIDYIEEIRLQKKYNFCQKVMLIIGYANDFSITLNHDVIGSYIGVPCEIIKHKKETKEYLILLDKLKSSSNCLKYRKVAPS